MQRLQIRVFFVRFLFLLFFLCLYGTAVNCLVIDLIDEVDEQQHEQNE